MDIFSLGHVEVCFAYAQALSGLFYSKLKYFIEFTFLIALKNPNWVVSKETEVELIGTVNLLLIDRVKAK